MCRAGSIYRRICCLLRGSYSRRRMKSVRFSQTITRTTWELIATFFFVEIALVSTIGIDHVSYILVLYSLASVMFLCTFSHDVHLWIRLIYNLVVNILITIYAKNPAPPLKRPVGGEGTRPNGHARPAEVVDDVQQFELEGLISDSDEERTPRERHSVERH